MSRIKSIAALILVLFAVGFVMDYQQVHAKNRRVASVVTRLGGSFGSIPAWPLGSEYRISFEHPLNNAQLKELVELNGLRGWVGVRFVNCNLSDSEQEAAIRMLDSCHVYWVKHPGSDTVVLNSPE